jgi:hypothetical protein
LRGFRRYFLIGTSIVGQIATATPTVSHGKSKLLPYQDPILRYKIGYPSNWDVRDRANGVIFVAPLNYDKKPPARFDVRMLDMDTDKQSELNGLNNTLEDLRIDNQTSNYYAGDSDAIELKHTYR